MRNTVLFGLSLWLLACGGTDRIRCKVNSDCIQGNINGTCLPSPSSSEQWCAFPDPGCAGSGNRWGVLAGDGLATECVEGSDAPDAGEAQCAPNQVSCNGKLLERCDSNGHPLEGESCELACVEAAGTTAAHCAFLEPKFLPGICDTAATEHMLAVNSGTLTVDTTGPVCNGGIVPQTGGPDLCVMRYGRFSISVGAAMKVSGPRALAIVTDGPLEILGTLDVSADGAVSGPGGGTFTSGSPGSNSDDASGGAGFAQSGGAGGSSSVDGAGGPGGPAFDPLAVAPLRGGPRGASSISGSGGGGGGGVTLISCRSKISVAGVIELGGGGGEGGSPGQSGPARGAAGGGSGGYLVLQAPRVDGTGKLYANGGGGGSGAGSLQNGQPGGDGSPSISPAHGGFPPGQGGGGGDGGVMDVLPGKGKKPSIANGSNTPGGGGGSIGHLQVYMPSGLAPTLAPAEASPGFDPLLAIPTK